MPDYFALVGVKAARDSSEVGVRCLVGRNVRAHYHADVFYVHVALKFGLLQLGSRLTFPISRWTARRTFQPRCMMTKDTWYFHVCHD